MKTRRGWQRHERDVAELLGLKLTTSSGNQFYDPGDAVDYSPLRDNDFALFADAKYTEKKSMALNAQVLRSLTEIARIVGKRPIMPVRFFKTPDQAEDYVVMRLDDFAELMGKSNGNS